MTHARTPPSDSDGPRLVAAAQELARRRWKVGLAVFVLVLAAVIAVLLLAHPVHRSEAKLRLGDPPPSGGVSPTAGLLGLWRPGGDPFANDMELLGSRSVAEGVVAAAALNAELDAPRGWHRDSLFVAFQAGRDTERATFQIEWTDEGSLSITRTAPSDSVVGTAAPGEEVSFGDVTVVSRPWQEGMPRTVRIATLPFAEAVRLTRQRLSAERVRREANVLDLQYDHTDPGVAQHAVSSWLDHFQELRSRLLERETTVTVDSLRARAETTLDQLRRAEEEMEAFQRRSRLVAPEVQSQVFAERYGEARTRLAELRLEREAMRSLLARVDSAANPAAVWTELAAHPRFLDNEMVGDLVTRLTDLEAQRKELALRRTEENPEHRMILEQLDDLDRMLRSLATSYATGLGEQLQQLETQVADLDTELATAPADAVELGRLQRSVRLLTEIVVATEQRLRQEELREALTFANVQVVDPPALRDRPVWPRRKLGLVVGLILASGFALLGMVVVERADGTVRRASQVRTAVGAPLLAAVPWSANGAGAPASREVTSVLLRAGGGSASELVVTPVDGRIAPAQVAAWLAPDEAGNGPRIRTGPSPTTYGAAAEATGQGASVALLAVRGRTRLDELRRAANRLEEAGGRVAGVILVCPGKDRVEDVWR